MAGGKSKEGCVEDNEKERGISEGLGNLHEEIVKVGEKRWS